MVKSRLGQKEQGVRQVGQGRESRPGEKESGNSEKEHAEWERVRYFRYEDMVRKINSGI